MSRPSVASTVTDNPVRSLDDIRPTPVKVGLQSDRAVGSEDVSVRSGVGDVIRRTVIAHYGTVKEAAYQLGKADPSLLMREFAAGKLERFDRFADATAKAVLADAFAAEWGHADPKTRMRTLVRAIRAHLDELADLNERRQP